MEQAKELDALCDLLVKIGEKVSDRVVESLREDGVEHCSAVHSKSESDVIYQIDQVAEEVIVHALDESAGDFGGIVLIAEGIGVSEVTVYPAGIEMKDAKWRIILDPIDGTRGLMYDKRPAFFLAGAAKNKGAQTRLSDVTVAVMVEIPTTRMFLSDTLSCRKGNGVAAVRRNLQTGNRSDFSPQPSSADSLRGGFAQFARFFTPGKDVLARLEEELLATLYPDAEDKEIVAFEDQYISSGGQLYEMLTGKDRFVGDVRRSLYEKYQDTMRGGHVCHPYDLAAHLIGVEAGLIITDIHGNPLDGPLETTHPMDWIGYANESIFNEVSPVLNCLLNKFNLL